MEKRTVKTAIKRLLPAILLLLLISGTSGRLDARAAGWKFGDQLSGSEKELYDALEQNYSTIKNYKNDNSVYIRLNGGITEAEGRSLAWFRVQRAFLMDHSELFWIRFLSMSLIMDWDRSAGAYTASGMDVYSLDRYPGIRKEIGSAQSQLGRAIAAVKKRSGRYAKVKAAHDYVIKLTTYPKDIFSEQYHAVTGPLLSKYSHKGVCEAYAWLFDIICKANGIPCVTLEGDSHAWNYVQMEDGKWYLVDTTWDDGSRISYNYFLVGSNTSVGGKKVKKTHRAASVSEIYQLNGVAPLKYPTLSQKAYKKAGSTAGKAQNTKKTKKKVASVRIKSPAKTVKAGKKLKLSATVLPKNASNRKLRWSSSNTKYATVTSKGVVKAKKAGKGKTVKITAKAADGSGKKATIKIKIK